MLAEVSCAWYLDVRVIVAVVQPRFDSWGPFVHLSLQCLLGQSWISGPQSLFCVGWVTSRQSRPGWGKSAPDSAGCFAPGQPWADGGRAAVLIVYCVLLLWGKCLKWMGKLGGICHHVGLSFIPFGLHQLHKQWGLPGPAHQSRDTWVGMSDKKSSGAIACSDLVTSTPTAADEDQRHRGF